ncbi:MAG: DNA polymerase III subunit delta [bacterium]|nr:MAG: DNA polymerase III subunit delta [bacterium]
MRRNLAYYKKLFDGIAAGPVGTLYLLKGPETFIMDEYASRLADSVVPDDMRSFDFSLAYGAEVDIDAFLATAHSFPFLSDRRMMVLKELERLRGGWDRLVAYCNNPVPSTVLVLLFNSHDDGGRRIRPPRHFAMLEKTVESRGTVFQFDKLNERDIDRWVMKKARRLGVRIEQDAAQALVHSVGENLYELLNELEKLSLIFEGEPVTVDDLQHVLGSHRVNALYDLIACLVPGGEADALRMVSRILNTGAERPSVVVYFLIRHFLRLLRIKVGLQGGAGGGERIGKLAERYETREIILWLENLRVTELRLKSISFPDEMLITLAILHSIRGEMLADGDTIHPAA